MDFGLVFLLAFGVIMALAMVLVVKAEKSPIVYDEMQQSVQGTAYKYTAITGILAGILAALLLNLDVVPMDGSFAMLTVSLLMVAVYTIHMILKGVFFGVSGKWKMWTVMEFILGLANTCTGVLRLYQDGLPTGKLTMVNANLMTGLLFLVVAGAVLVRKAMEKKDHAL